MSQDAKDPKAKVQGFLRGNFKVKKEVVDSESSETKSSAEKLQEEFRKKAMSSLGGSMVYVDRTKLNWDGDGTDEK